MSFALLEGIQEQWNQCEGLTEENLLRLGLLREAVKTLHTQKSHHLAAGRKMDVDQIKLWEEKIYRLREAPTLSGSLTELLDGKGIAPGRRSRLLPQGLFHQIPRERLERYDRHWEALLAAEAIHLGWSFWALSGKVRIETLSESDQKLHEKLWPNGLVLFSEPATTKDGGIAGEFWHGQWLLVIESRFKHPQELHLDMASISPGQEDSWKWKLLYTASRSSGGV